jgi:hypothetical protein
MLELRDELEDESGPSSGPSKGIKERLSRLDTVLSQRFSSRVRVLFYFLPDSRVASSSAACWPQRVTGTEESTTATSSHHGTALTSPVLLRLWGKRDEITYKALKELVAAGWRKGGDGHTTMQGGRENGPV